MDARRLSRYVIPLLLLALFAFEKASLNFDSRNERMGDGVYYFQIAQHVANGDGLRTSVSLRGQGLRDMPSPATVQPLWPLVLGYAGRVLGMDRAAHLLPEAFYFGSLLLLYLLANQLGSAFGSRDLIRFRGITVLDLGTLAAAIFGVNAVFSAYTSKAYTEGLAFCLLFAALLALATLFAALSALAPVHVSHMAVGMEWLFGWRHGLPLILAILLALAFLCRYGTWVRIALILVVAVGTLNRESPLDRYIRGADRMVTEEERALLDWIDQHPRPPVVLSLMGRWLAASSRAVAHVPSCDSAAMLENHLSALILDYVVIHPRDLRVCPALRNVNRNALELVRSFGHGPRHITVWRPANAPTEEGTEIQGD